MTGVNYAETIEKRNEYIKWCHEDGTATTKDGVTVNSEHIARDITLYKYTVKATGRTEYYLPIELDGYRNLEVPDIYEDVQCYNCEILLNAICPNMSIHPKVELIGGDILSAVPTKHKEVIIDREIVRVYEAFIGNSYSHKRIDIEDVKNCLVHEEGKRYDKVELIRRYNIIDKNERNAKAELKEYTFEEVKNFFEPDTKDPDMEETHRKWELVQNVYQLEDFLEWSYAGMAIPYEIVEVKE